MTMFGVDTNVLVRLLANDDLAQRRSALDFADGLGRDYTAFVPLVAIVELDWALRSKLGFSRRDVVAAIGKLLRARGLVFEHHNVVLRALHLVSSANADFADAVIASVALQAGCRSTKTFDRKAASHIPEMELLA